MKLTEQMPQCTRCGRTCYPVNVSTPTDTEPVYVPGCDCHPVWPHEPVTAENERQLLGW